MMCGIIIPCHPFGGLLPHTRSIQGLTPLPMMLPSLRDWGITYIMVTVLPTCFYCSVANMMKSRFLPKNTHFVLHTKQNTRYFVLHKKQNREMPDVSIKTPHLISPPHILLPFSRIKYPESMFTDHDITLFSRTFCTIDTLFSRSFCKSLHFSGGLLANRVKSNMRIYFHK